LLPGAEGVGRTSINQLGLEFALLKVLPHRTSVLTPQNRPGPLMNYGRRRFNF